MRPTCAPAGSQVLPLASLPRVPSALHRRVPAALSAQIPGTSGEVTSSCGTLCWGEECCCAGVRLEHPVIAGSHKPRESPNGPGSCSHPLCGSCAVRFPAWGSSSPLHQGKATGQTLPHLRLDTNREIPKDRAVTGETNWFAPFFITTDDRQRWAPGRKAFPGVHTGPRAQKCAAPVLPPAGQPWQSHAPLRAPRDPPRPGQIPSCSRTPGSALQPLCAK